MVLVLEKIVLPSAYVLIFVLNLQVTLISNLDKFGIDLKMIAKELRSAKACSTSIQEERGDSFVLAQGNHASFIHKLLKGKLLKVF